MNRRGFLQAILAAGVAPWVITKAGVLMPVRQIWQPLNRSLFVSAPLQIYGVGQWYPHRGGGKSWFAVQEAIRRARANPEGKIALLSFNVEPARSFLETIAGPAGVPENLIHRPQPRGKI